MQRRKTRLEPLGFPRFNVNGFAALGPANSQPQAARVTDIQSGFKLTWVEGHHVMKWGFDHIRTRYNQPYWNQNRGTYTFNGAWTGTSFADFLLGMMNGTQRQVGFNRNYVRATSMDGYFSDDIKATPKLTLNLGIRHEIDLNFHDRYNRMTNFVPALGKVVLAFDDPSVRDLIAAANLQDHVTYAKAAGLPPSLVHTDYNNFAPRAGFAWTPWNDRKTVLLGGYGVFYTGHLLNNIRNQLLNTFPYSQQESYNRVATRPDLVTLSDPFPAEIRVSGGINTSSGYQVDAPTSYLQSYSLTVERSLGGVVRRSSMLASAKPGCAGVKREPAACYGAWPSDPGETHAIIDSAWGGLDGAWRFDALLERDAPECQCVGRSLPT